jgi:hypothetical protein
LFAARSTRFCDTRTVDSDVGNDTPAIGCDAIKLRTIQLDLVNTQDLAADAWVAPPAADAMTIPKGLKPSPAYAGLVKKLTAPRRKLSAQGRTCARGLVSVDGECVPKLKR